MAICQVLTQIRTESEWLRRPTTAFTISAAYTMWRGNVQQRRPRRSDFSNVIARPNHLWGYKNQLWSLTFSTLNLQCFSRASAARRLAAQLIVVLRPCMCFSISLTWGLGQTSASTTIGVTLKIEALVFNLCQKLVKENFIECDYQNRIIKIEVNVQFNVLKKRILQQTG